MKVLLVNPPRSPHNDILAYAPEEAKRFIHRKLIGPPLGLMTVAAALRDHDISLLEMKGEYDLNPTAPPPEELLKSWLERAAPSVVGVTFIASEYEAGMALLRAAKKWDPAIVTVAGGLHATLCPNDFARPEVDIVCPGQATVTVRELVCALEENRSVESVPGLLVRTDRGLVRTPGTPTTVDPVGRDFVRPDRSLVKPWISTYRVGSAPGPVTYLYTSLGCPNRCSFCSIWPQLNGACYQRTVESIVEELGTLDDYPVVRFADANTVIDPAWARRLFEAIERAGIRKEYVIDMRPDTTAANPDLVELMARNGLKVVISGFESFRAAELTRYGKATTPAHIDEAVRVFRTNGVMVRGNYVIPPDYGPDDFAALSAFAGERTVAYAGYTILTPMPGTRYYSEVHNDIVDHDLSRYNFFNCVMRSRLPREEFCRSVGRLWLIKEGTETI